MKIQEFINKLLSSGRYSFNINEVEKTLNLNKAAALNTLSRIKQKKSIASPARGFYLIVPPEYQAYGCLPADMFVSDLMKHFDLPYYVGFLSAAQYYGAAHQKPQRFQVVTSKNRPPITCGRIYIEFIANANLANAMTRSFNTVTGKILVASPEVLAADLVSAPQHAAGINNVATVLAELAENINPKELIALTKINQQLFWQQRLGYLLEFLGLDKLANELEKNLRGKKLNWARLISRGAYKPLERNSKWKIIVNTEVEPDE